MSGIEYLVLIPVIAAGSILADVVLTTIVVFRNKKQRSAAMAQLEALEAQLMGSVKEDPEGTGGRA